MHLRCLVGEVVEFIAFLNKILEITIKAIYFGLVLDENKKSEEYT